MTEKKRQYGREFQLQGVAAVWQVASQVALRGHTPLFPGLDEGYDLQLNNGLRLQVKASILRCVKGVNYRNGGYCFGLRRGAWDSKEKKYKRSTLRSYSEVADYFVLWGIDENRFFIVPTSHTGQTIWFGRKGTKSNSRNSVLFDKITEGRLENFEDRWDLLDVRGTADALIESATVLKETANDLK